MILCEFCSWESYQEEEFEGASKTRTTCNSCKHYEYWFLCLVAINI